MAADDLLALTYREESGRILAALTKQVGDLGLAEDALQDAMAEALVSWRRDGPPDNRGAWLLTVSRRRAIDRLRREVTRRNTASASAAMNQLEQWQPSWEIDGEIPDERLRLIFTCCHPALPADARVALTLRTLCGLTTAEIARAFLVTVTTMRQRITRAKDKIRRKGIPYAVPKGPDLSARLEAVLDVIYLIFNEGYAPTASAVVIRTDLCHEAIRLAEILRGLKPTPEAGGLLALMLLNDARRPARTSNDGSYVSLADQDRSRWDRQRIAEGQRLLRDCLAHQRPGRYQIQAAISAVHCDARCAAETDWLQIAGLYVALSQAAPSPVVTVNHAVAVSHAESPIAGLELLEPVASQLQSYQPFHAARAELLFRIGRFEEAAAAYGRCLELTSNTPERRFLERRRSEARRQA